MGRKTYIGDGVYAEDDGFGVWLITERENGTHRIYLEPGMLAELTEWLAGRHDAPLPTVFDDEEPPATPETGERDGR